MGSNKTALLIGAGFVAKPTAQDLSDAGIEVIVGCRTLTDAQAFCKGIANARAIPLDVKKSDLLDAEVAKVDVVICLGPYTLHADVIKSAVKNKKNVVTTSYVSESMMALEKEVKEAGITVMNEIGLDPGIDHLYAVKTIDEVHKAGGKITSFLSYCGGLPAPEDSGNVLGYKFSWSSRGVLLALRNAAKYYLDGEIVEVSGPELMGTAKPYHIYPGFAFVAYPNRDSTPYRERYNIPEAQTVIRGTLRYSGFPDVIRVLVDIGFLSDEPMDFLAASSTGKAPTWAETTAKVVHAPSTSEQDLESAISSKTKFRDDEEKNRILKGLRDLGLFSDQPVTPRGNPLDTLCANLEEKLKFDKGERDLVILQHRFSILWSNGRTEERTSTLCEYGEPTSETSRSAMAKLVGIPCAVAVKMVLDGRISEKGILAPLTPKLTEPLIEELKKYGIEMKEKTVFITPAEK